MNIITQFLTKNEWSRPGTPIKQVKAVVLHWTSNDRIGAQGNWRFFQDRRFGKTGYGSAHYIIGQDGTCIYCIPETEQAYHSGSKDKDPISGQIYTDEARKRFGVNQTGAYAGICSNPNNWSIGIELCNFDSQGTFTEATLNVAKELCANILKRYNLGVDALTTHHNLVGWKDCPRLWTRKPELFEQFKEEVAQLLEE